MRFLVPAVSMDDTPQAVLKSEDPNAQSLVIGELQTSILPLFPEYFGELVAIALFKAHHDFRRSGFPGTHSRNISGTPLRRPVLESFWLGRLTATWQGEPVVKRLISFGSEEDVEGEPLSRVLHRLFRHRFGDCLHLFLGTQESLVELQRLVGEYSLGFSFRKVAEAAVGLWIPPEEVKRFSLVEAKIGESIAENTLRIERLKADMLAAEAALKRAREEFNAEHERITGEKSRLESLDEVYSLWKEYGDQPLERVTGSS